MNLDTTINSEDWLINNKAALEAFVPAQWTHMDTVKDKIAHGLKDLGVNWTTHNEFLRVLFALYESGYIHFDGPNCRRDPRYFDYLQYQQEYADRKAAHERSKRFTLAC